jgi:sec-independent protein translocase protein TatA
MIGLSAGHILVLLIVLLIFGPRRLPELGSTLGRALKGLKDGMNGTGLDAALDKLESDATPKEEKQKEKA